MQQHPEKSMCFLCIEHYCRKLQELCVYEGFTWTLGFLFCRCFNLRIASLAYMLRLRSRRLTEMLTEQIMLQETQDRWLIGSRPLLSKYALCQAGHWQVRGCERGNFFFSVAGMAEVGSMDVLLIGPSLIRYWRPIVGQKIQSTGGRWFMSCPAIGWRMCGWTWPWSCSPWPWSRVSRWLMPGSGLSPSVWAWLCWLRRASHTWSRRRGNFQKGWKGGTLKDVGDKADCSRLGSDVSLCW